MADAPKVSVVVPTFARSAELARCLDGIARLEASTFSFEVIVVDDGGPEPLDGLIEKYVEVTEIRLVRQSRGGPAAARNAGVAIARGSFLAFIDDDCVPAPGWLAALVQGLERDDRQLLGGRVENALTGNPYSTASAHIAEFVYDYSQAGRVREPFFTTNNMALTADLFRSLGGFETSIPSGTSEDKEFCDRWSARGLALEHVPAAVVYHAHDLTFPRFLRQHFNYGRGALAYRVIRRHRLQTLFLPESLKFYTDLVSSPMHAPTSIGRTRLIALLIASQIAMLAGAIREVVNWPRLIQARSTSRQLEPT